MTLRALSSRSAPERSRPPERGPPGRFFASRFLARQKMRQGKRRRFTVLRAYQTKITDELQDQSCRSAGMLFECVNV
jgi:hypothetical protein